MTDTREERCEAGCIAFHGGERRHHPDRVFYPDSFTALHDKLARDHAALQAEHVRLKTALDAALAENREIRVPGTSHPTHHHRKGGLYRLIARGRIEATLEPCAIYESVTDDLVWVRPDAEFEDGRFTALVPESDLPRLAPLPERRSGS